ncbi:MAG: hypothetical protein ABW168_12060 [Sedimenticola sp.]
MSQQPTSKPKQSKKKRKKSATTSPPNPDSKIQTKKSKLILEGDIETDIEYLSAAEYSDCPPPPATMDTRQQPPITAFTTKSAKYMLSEDEREDIAQRSRALMKEELSVMFAELMKPIKDELCETKNQLKIQIDKNTKLESEVKDLQIAIDEQEQYSRRACLRINGVIGDEGSPTENVERKLLMLAESNNIQLQPADIDVAHRVGKPKPGYTRPVIVKFSNSKARQRVMAARKNLDNIYINEDLTRYRQSIHYHARVLVKNKILERTWVAGAKIFCRFPSSAEGTKIQIRSMDDIEAIRNGKPLTTPLVRQ